MVTGTMSQSQMAAEIKGLRESLTLLQQALEARPRLVLRTPQPNIYLGQPVTVIATVADGEGSPLTDARVAFVATWGELRAADGYTSQAGSAVTARTGVDGTARFALFPETSEELHPVQFDALREALSALDPEAATPRDAQAGLAALARQYRWEANAPFRQAVDVLFRDGRQRPLDPVNARDEMLAWSYVNATVVAYVIGDSDVSSAQAIAVLPMRFRDWLRPWLQVYRADSETEAGLREGLLDVKARGGGSAVLVSGVHEKVRDFLRRQSGVIGEAIATRAASRVLQGFLASDVNDLPASTLQEVGPALNIAARTMATGTYGMLDAFEEAAASLHRELDTRMGKVESDVIGPLAGRVGVVETGLSTKAEQAAVAGLQTSTSQLLAAKMDKATFVTFARDEATFRVKTEGTLSNKQDASTFATFQKQSLDSLATKADASAVTSFQNALDSVKDDVAKKVNLTDYSRFAISANTQLTTLRNTTTGLQTTTTDLKKTADELKTTTDKLSTDVVTLDKSIVSIGNNVVATRTDVFRLRRP